MAEGTLFEGWDNAVCDWRDKAKAAVTEARTEAKDAVLEARMEAMAARQMALQAEARCLRIEAALLAAGIPVSEADGTG